jgi:hypothetical protein
MVSAPEAGRNRTTQGPLLQYLANMSGGMEIHFFYGADS